MKDANIWAAVDFQVLFHTCSGHGDNSKCFSVTGFRFKGSVPSTSWCISMLLLPAACSGYIFYCDQPGFRPKLVATAEACLPSWLLLWGAVACHSQSLISLRGCCLALRLLLWVLLPATFRLPGLSPFMPAGLRCSGLLLLDCLRLWAALACCRLVSKSCLPSPKCHAGAVVIWISWPTIKRHEWAMTKTQLLWGDGHMNRWTHLLWFRMPVGITVRRIPHRWEEEYPMSFEHAESTAAVRWGNNHHCAGASWATWESDRQQWDGMRLNTAAVCPSPAVILGCLKGLYLLAGVWCWRTACVSGEFKPATECLCQPAQDNGYIYIVYG